MVGLSLQLPTGHYHATPWGRHVNEGEVEWPPSPWRLVRALISTWHHKAQREISEDVVRGLIEKLASTLPEYRLPAVTLGHSRHYMPLYNSARDDKTVKVFDTFACVSEDVGIVWPGVVLSEAESSALSTLAGLLGYLGRAESWVEGTMVMSAGTPNCLPVGTDGVAAGQEAVRLLAPLPAGSYGAWVTASGFSTNGHAKKKAGPAVPKDLWTALHVETGALKAAGWSDPPGSRWVFYARPQELFNTRAAGTTRRVVEPDAPTVARYAVTSTVPPLFMNGISTAEKVHKAMVEQACKVYGDGKAPCVFTGKGDDGKPLPGHRHLHVLWEANDPRRLGITHLTLYAPEGFGLAERRVLERLRLLYGAKGHDVQLVLLGTGAPADFQGLKVMAGQCPLFVTSKVWVSRTPFVPTRHPKRYHDGRPKLDDRGLPIGGPEHDLRRLLAEQGYPEVSVSGLETTDVGSRPVPFYKFRTQRYQGEGRRGDLRGYGFRLEFAEPVTGPIAVGYGAHFGLGVFEPAEVPVRPGILNGGTHIG